MRTSLLLLGVAGAAALAYAARRRTVEGFAEPKAPPKVRDAGPEAMASPPRRWDRTDQQVDESFPASDPPGNY